MPSVDRQLAQVGAVPHGQALDHCELAELAERVRAAQSVALGDRLSELPREPRVETDETARTLTLGRGDHALLADFANETVELT